MIKSIGHENNKLKLKNIVLSGNIANAYLFVGKAGIGKKIVATEFAKSILCENPLSGVACDSCRSCLTFDNNSDFKVISPVKDVIKVDMVRELIEELFLKPTISQRKVFIIDDADKMNEQAQNALLKVLEEPPDYATVILIASSKEKLLNTIKSRVVEFLFDKLTDGEIISILKKRNNNIDDDMINMCVKYANGSALKALEVVNDSNFEIENDIAKSILEKDFLKMNQKFELLKSDKSLKADIPHVLEKVMYIFYHKLKTDITFDYRLIEILENTIENIKKNANLDLALDAMMISILETKR
ncbi:MAG: DNA polymerase III subunit [Clostridia bacterium]|nr:DNA polymerase III subunit [Clostridia bacterium]